jgi:nitrite reductase (NADH) small subunit
MSEWTRLGPEPAMPGEGEAKEFAAGGKTLCVARVNGALCAMDNECPHRGGPLAEGTVEEGKIVCPWHAWAFDPKTGAASHNPNAKVAVYEIRIEGGDVFTKL